MSGRVRPQLALSPEPVHVRQQGVHIAAVPLQRSGRVHRWQRRMGLRRYLAAEKADDHTWPTTAESGHEKGREKNQRQKEKESKEKQSV